MDSLFPFFVGADLRRITLYTVEVVQVLGLDHIETSFGQALLQSDHLSGRDLRSFTSLGYKTASPVIDGKRIRQAAGINLHTAVCDVEKLHAVAVYAFDQFAQLIRDSIETSLPPIEKDVDTDEVFFLSNRRRKDGFRIFVNDVRRIFDRFQRLRLLS